MVDITLRKNTIFYDKSKVFVDLHIFDGVFRVEAMSYCK